MEFIFTWLNPAGSDNLIVCIFINSVNHLIFLKIMSFIPNIPDARLFFSLKIKKNER